MDNILMTFSPNRTNIPADGFVTSNLKLRAPDNATPRDYTIPVSALITYPSEFFGNPSANVTENSNITVTVLPSLTIPEQLNIFLHDWFNPLTGVITTLLSISAGVAGWTIGNRKKNMNIKS
jgi:hypothetical protein